MVSVTEHEKIKMQFSAEHRERVSAAVQTDRLFSAFEIEMTPAEAFTFAEVAPPAGVTKLASLRYLVERINDVIPPANFGPDHPRTGKTHHSYRIGRERGFRLVKLSIFKGFFQLDYDFMQLLKVVHSIGAEAGAEVVIETDNNSYSVVMRWGGSNR